MNQYTLDANDCPRLAATFEDYYAWKDALPKDIQTGIGFQVGKTERDGVCVSTVYLGSDHGWDEGPPVLWETMIFGGECDEHCERYTSQRAAVAGHKAACKRYLSAEATLTEETQ